MGQNKLVRFEAINTFPNVLQYPKEIKGKWSGFFKNQFPITLELACGKGEYSVGLGRIHRDRNFIGVDIKGNRIYVGAKKALAEQLNNVAFLRCQIAQLAEYFLPGEISEIWIVFPDPFLRESRAKNRLTHARFLRIYQTLLCMEALIHLKTDSKELFDFTLETIAEQGCKVHEVITDVYGQAKAKEALAIQTFYEQMHLAAGRTIYYIQFSLPNKEIIVSERKLKEHAGKTKAR